MSKYNHIKSIPIESIPKGELEQAVNEWAEGSKYLEELIWACLENGIETSGCHYGKSPYLGMQVNQAHDKVRRMLRVLQEVENSQVLLSPDGGNPLSGADWYKANISIGFYTNDEKTTDEVLHRISKSLTNNTEDLSKVEVFEHMLDFHDFFKGKESGLNFRSRNKSGEYIFSIESSNRERGLDYHNMLFEKANLEKIEDEKIPIDVWRITAKTPEEFNEKISKCKEIIMNEWELELPTDINQVRGLNAKALVNKRKFGDTAEGQQRFEEWLNNEEERIKLSRSIKTGEAYKNKGILPSALQRAKELFDKITGKMQETFKGKDDDNER